MQEKVSLVTFTISFVEVRIDTKKCTRKILIMH